MAFFCILGAASPQQPHQLNWMLGLRSASNAKVIRVTEVTSVLQTGGFSKPDYIDAADAYGLDATMAGRIPSKYLATFIAARQFEGS